MTRPTFAIRYTPTPTVRACITAVDAALRTVNQADGGPANDEAISAMLSVILGLLADLPPDTAATMCDRRFGEFCATMFKSCGMDAERAGPIVAEKAGAPN